MYRNVKIFFLVIFPIWFLHNFSLFSRSSTTTTWCPLATVLTSASTRTTLTRRSWKIPWRRRRPAIRSVPLLKKDTRKAKTDGSSQNWDSKYTSWTFLYEEFKKIKALNKRLLIVLFECLLIFFSHYLSQINVHFEHLKSNYKKTLTHW